ncbi:cobalt import ATP-binding protein CbiO 1 [Dorea sp. D27]|nr:cobalt import ATP-binding protein CbiO 1 [Dorea sp. D27]
MIAEPEQVLEDIIIEARDVHYSYEEGGQQSLNGVSLKIGRGKKVAFMGANGSGKSTFLCAATAYTGRTAERCSLPENQLTIPERG